jgi:hypothetical protein
MESKGSFSMPLVNDQTLKSPSCLNHLKHGATATTLFLDDENPDYFAPTASPRLGPQLFASKMQSRRAAILGSQAAF